MYTILPQQDLVEAISVDTTDAIFHRSVPQPSLYNLPVILVGSHPRFLVLVANVQVHVFQALYLKYICIYMFFEI